MKKALRFVKESKILLVFSGVIITLFVAVIDYLTGYELGLSLFYLAPVFILSFMIGRSAGVLIAILAAISWTTADRLASRTYTHIFVFYWNVVGRAILFTIFAFIISSLKQAIEREKQFARKDFITDIANAKAFYEVAPREIERVRRYKYALTIAYIDCDNFKVINDTFGHKEGDSFLRSLAQAIQDNIRAIDFVARLGGDEFALLLPETEHNMAKEVVERIKDILLKSVKSRNLPITYSIGVATFTYPPDSVEEMIKSADSLMYQAKKHGKNMIKYGLFSKSSANSKQEM